MRGGNERRKLLRRDARNGQRPLIPVEIAQIQQSAGRRDRPVCRPLAAQLVQHVFLDRYKARGASEPFGLRFAQPERFGRAARFVSIKEYVLHELCGEWAADWSIASASGLLNLRNLDWDEGALAVAGITAQKLSPLVSTTHLLALSATTATALGLAAGLPMVAGATDG